MLILIVKGRGLQASPFCVFRREDKSMVDDARVLALAEYMEETARIAEHERRKNYTMRAGMLREFGKVLRALVDIAPDVSPADAARDAVLSTVRRG